MRAERGRAKKLIVAFHFHQSEQAGWKCDSCREAGLERKRRCGWLPGTALDPVQIVWSRGRVATDRCPKSEVSAQSLEWLERFFVWRTLGPKYPGEPSAREVEAFLILEQELAGERNHG
ncbi:MAG: hypothetical protein HY013_08900 [Candidatus Solibacter usitatus]|nr:hypothetical protein [Candidatus Solibacter usitatus]